MQRILIACAMLAALCLPAAAQKSWYFAADYGQWAIPGQQANTYIIQGANACLESNGAMLFFPFKTNAPVLIADSTTANSEVVTPSTVVNTSGQCGITATALNSHNGFYLKSGTAGLQEAINALGSGSSYAQTLYIDTRWYQMAANVPGTTSAAIIAAASGNTSINIVDLTTAPATYYAWNGSTYLPTVPTARYSATSATNISAPTALSTAAASAGKITTATTGGTIPATSTYRLAATYVDAAGGETKISTDTASTATIASGSTSTNVIAVTSPAAATGAIGWRLYMSAASGAAGSEILYTPTCAAPVLSTNLTGVCAIGAKATITAVVTGTATVPAVNSAYPSALALAPSLTAPRSFLPFPALGTIASAATGTMGAVNLPVGWLNSLGRTIKVCGNGYATTNGTGGTITLATTLASVPGVTSITPFTAISGSIAASVIQVPIDFCATYSTTAIGTSGTLEAHGIVHYGLAGTAVDSPAMDYIFAASSTVDLTVQDQLAVTISPTTAGLTAAQLRQFTIELIN